MFVASMLFLALLLPLANAQTQTELQNQKPLSVQTPQATLSVEGRRLETTELAKLPRRMARVRGPEGRTVNYEGVSLAEVLLLAGVKLGDALRGRELARYALVEAADGYRVVFALAELDPAFRDDLVLLADRRDGLPLDALEGPLRLIVPGEKRQARWVRQVSTITLHSASGAGR